MSNHTLSLLELDRPRTNADMRRETLMRLYARRDAVDNLIRSLENYQRCSSAHKAECIPLTFASRQ